MSKINGHLVAKIVAENTPSVRLVIAYKQAVYGIKNIELFMMSVEGWWWDAVKNIYNNFGPIL